MKGPASVYGCSNLICHFLHSTRCLAWTFWTNVRLWLPLDRALDTAELHHHVLMRLSVEMFEILEKHTLRLGRALAENVNISSDLLTPF